MIKLNHEIIRSGKNESIWISTNFWKWIKQINELFKITDKTYMFNDEDQFCEIELKIDLSLKNRKTNYYVSLPDSVVDEIGADGNESQLEYDIDVSFNYDFYFDFQDTDDEMNKDTDLKLIDGDSFDDSDEFYYQKATILNIWVFGSQKSDLASELEEEIDLDSDLETIEILIGEAFKATKLKLE